MKIHKPAPPRLQASLSFACGLDERGQALPPGASPQPTQAPACGQPGQACCASTANPNGFCYGVGNSCQIGSRICLRPQDPIPPKSAVRCNHQPATRASRLFALGLVDKFGCGAATSVLADSQEEADACAAADAPSATVVHEALSQSPFCIRRPLGKMEKPETAFRPGDTRYVASDSDEHAQSCIAHLSLGTAIEPGACPMK